MQARRIAGTVAGLVTWAWMTPALADTVVTRDNQIHRGTILNESELGITLKDVDGKLWVFYRDDVRQVRRTRKEKARDQDSESSSDRESDDTPRPRRTDVAREDKDAGETPPRQEVYKAKAKAKAEPRFFFADVDLSPLILSTKGTKAGILTAGAQASVRASLGGTIYLAGGFDFAQSLSQQARNPATVYTAPWGAAEIHLSGLVLGVGAAMASVADGTAAANRVSTLVPRVTLGYQYRPDSGAKIGINLLYGQALNQDSNRQPQIQTWGGFFTLGYGF
jgi:hypothetical protein